RASCSRASPGSSTEPADATAQQRPQPMITLTTTQLQTWLAQLLWPFVRIGSCFMVAPAFGAIFVPARLRIVLAGAIALAIAPLLPAPAAIEPFSAAGFVVTAQQVLIGVALGFCIQTLFDAV